MQVISRAGIAWLEQHGLRLENVIYEARIRRYITRKRFDLIWEGIPPFGSDWFEFKNNGWRLEHRFGIYTYKERANGIAVLNVDGVKLPAMVCSRLAGKLEPLESLIEIDPACVAQECEGLITSVANKSDGSVDIRLRLKWIDTLTQCQL